jgi:acetyl esterase/lipase
MSMDVAPLRAGLVAALALTLVTGQGAVQPAAAQDYGVISKPNVPYVEHDGVNLTGDFYAPKGLDKAPVIIAVHGGGWQGGSPDAFKYFGPYLARHGYAVYAIRYRLSKPGARSYPAAVYDVKAAIQFVRAKAADLGVDPARIALLGASAGAHLVSLVGIAGKEPQFSTQYRDDPNAAVSPDVKAVVSFYAWLARRAHGRPCELYLGRLAQGAAVPSDGAVTGREKGPARTAGPEFQSHPGPRPPIETS